VNSTHTKENKDNYCILMAGGSGTRFWPLSTSKNPKQYHDILGVGKTLIQLTFDRISAIIPKENIFVITNEQYKDITQEQLHIKEEQIILEPYARNTAPCNIYGALKIHKLNPNATILVSPSDHIITNEQNFTETIQYSINKAKEDNRLITLGINPTNPNTGYGYIQYDSGNLQERLKKVKLFTEKPDLEIAKSFVASGDFVWNSGIFIWSAKSILQSFEANLPEMYASFKEIEQDINTEKEIQSIKKLYSHTQNLSIDYGILEKSNDVFVVPSSFGWSDLGTWGSLYEQSKKDKHKNAVFHSTVVLDNAEGNLVRSQKEKIVIIKDLKGYAVIDTKNVLMVIPLNADQEVKNYVNKLKLNKIGDNFI
jgi:mannose-1-phosphate guanylyltransferase